ncbi:hypothetical protein KO02_19745 [Sphingobacterium sp. ML3W]|nr:hypothetical protein KO02_19745 [Sphingobacterium sp. ML3W]
MFNNLTYKTVSIVIFSILLFSCKKHPLEDTPVSPETGTRMELTIDSLYLYAKEIYLWNEALPSYATFTPRDKYKNITPEINALRKELFDISQFKINDNTNLPYEFSYYGSPKYSSIFEQTKVNLKANLSSSRKTSNNDLTIIQINNISYLAIHEFPQLREIKSDLDEIFSEISIQSPNTIVIDLRYNQGGYIETVEYLANLIASSKLKGKVMYTESYNPTLQSGKAKILKHQPYTDSNGNSVIINGRQANMADVDYSEKGNTYYFDKKNNLESVKNIYFITSGTTASASELLISLFKPYYDVKLVGQKTFGKPVGFFAVNIDKYVTYMSSFLIKNANGWSNYFDGMQPNIEVELSSNPNLGDPNEECLKSIILDVNGDLNMPLKSETVFRKSPSSKHKYNEIGNKGMSLENRLKLKY